MTSTGGTGDHVAGVVLAAGEGRRMGAPKALLTIDGQPLVARAIATLRDGGCDPVGVITGAAGEEVAAAVGDAAAVIPNPAWADGMAGSVTTALAWAGSLDPAVAALVILPVDTPGIGPAAVTRLLQHPDDGRAVVATYDGRPRNPVLLPARVWSEVAARVHGDTGARVWLRAHPDQVVEIDCTDLADPADLDTPEDLDRWSTRSSTASTTGAPDGA